MTARPSPAAPAPADPAGDQAGDQAGDGSTPGAGSADRRRRLPDTLRALPGPLLLLVGATAATRSVVQYALPIVAVYTCLAVLLALWLWRARGRVELTPVAGALVLAAAAAVLLLVPGFTYLQPGPAEAVRLVLAGAGLVAAVSQLLPWRHSADTGLAVVVAGYLTVTALLVHGDPAPRIDVWYTLQGAADALAHGGDPYTQVWVGPPGIMQAFTYLPWTAVLLAPGRWLAGDVRWMLAAVTVAGALAVRGFGGRILPSTGPDAAPDLGGPGAAAARAPQPRAPQPRAPQPRGPQPRARAAAAFGALLLLLPGTPTQVEQAWTEPLLLTCLAGAGLALARRRWWSAALLLALALASKQHVAVLLPVLAVWPRLGARRTAVAAGLAGVLVAPFLLADPAAMWHDTITYLVDFPALKFADTLYIAAMHELHWLPPFWLTGALVLGTVGSVAVAVHRRNPGIGELLRWCALVLLIANLLNKQAFYNQYWLVLALVVASWAVPDSADGLTGEQPLQPDGQVVPAPDSGHPLPPA